MLFSCLACSNSQEFETGEIKTIGLIKNALEQLNRPKTFLDARSLIDRKKIDKANIPVLFVELETGQNGTLTPYPGQGIGQTWLGADGPTITFAQGVLKASRGMGDDVMGGASSMPPWDGLTEGKFFSRHVGYLSGNNQIQSVEFTCKIKKGVQEVIIVWDVPFKVTPYEETCNSSNIEINNVYFLDQNKMVRKSIQYHSPTIGYIMTERLER